MIMDSKYHDDWQSSKKTVLERNTHMFDNELMSDVSFTCGEFISRIFHAHKYVLATSSAVFYAMFYGNLAQKESTIRITDTDEESFNEFLRFLYTDDCKITAENAIGVMYLAKKYLILPLAEKCCKVLEASIKPDNVFAVLEQAAQFDESDLEAKCWDIVSKNTLECVNSGAFCSIGSHTLNALLKNETLVIAEVDLFKAVLKWVDSEYARQGINIEDDKMARRRILGDSVYEIRFLAMSQHDFAKYVPPIGLLSDEEIISIFREFSDVNVTGLQWKNQGKRQFAGMVGFGRFQLDNVIVGADQEWKYDLESDASDALSVVVTEAVLFYGVRLFGNSDGKQYKVKFTVKENNVTGTYTSEQDNDGVWGYDVMLSKPVALRAGEKFTISATIKGPPSHREKCCKALEASIRSDNVFVVLEQAVKFDESDLEAKCWDIVSSKTQECITTEAFCNIGPHTLNALLKSEVLVIAEVDLFKAVLKWVDSECARQGINIEDDKMARRRILGDSLYEIRFLAMSQHDFATYASPTGILTYEEMVGIFQKLNGLDAVGLKWKNKGSRRLARMVSFGRFVLANIIGNITWYYVRNLPDTLSLVVNKAVLFHGVRLFGDAGGSQYDVKFTIKDKDDNVTGTYTSEQDSDGVWGYDIMLSKPIALLRNEEVTIVALIKGPPSYRGQNGKSSVKVDDVIVTFKNATGDLSTNGTGYITGQFYKIFLSSAV